MTASVDALTQLALGPYAAMVDRWHSEVDWQIDADYAPRPDGCEHGGASFTAIGQDFRNLARRHQVVAADVLDAWFEPAPGVLAALAEDPGWSARTSPPTDAAGLLAEVAASRALPAGRACRRRRLLRSDLPGVQSVADASSRVLLVDPGYGEYAHVTERVIGCQVDRFRLRRDEDWRIDPARLSAVVASGGYDLVVVVNPNNPTGRHAPPRTCGP